MAKHYYYLKEGEKIREGDEVEVSANYNDPPKWQPSRKENWGKFAPNPDFISHRKYRRLLTLDLYWNALSSDERTRIVERAFQILDNT